MDDKLMEKLSDLLEQLFDSLIEDETTPIGIKVMILLTTAFSHSNKIMNYINEDSNHLQEHSTFLGFILEDLKKFIVDAKELEQRIEDQKNLTKFSEEE